jgi:hypothetical protein
VAPPFRSRHTSFAHHHGGCFPRVRPFVFLLMICSAAGFMPITRKFYRVPQIGSGFEGFADINEYFQYHSNSRKPVDPNAKPVWIDKTIRIGRPGVQECHLKVVRANQIEASRESEAQRASQRPESDCCSTRRRSTDVTLDRVAERYLVFKKTPRDEYW